LKWKVAGLNVNACRVGTEPITINGQGNDNFFHGGFSGNVRNSKRVGRWPANLILHEGTIKEEWARYFYASKVSKREREAGLNRFGKKKHAHSGGAQKAIKEGKNYNAGQTLGLNRVKELANNHPCLKPIDLCRYLALLLLPPAQKGKTRRMLVPFSGAGSEMIGARLAGWDHVTGIEINSRYAKIAKARIEHWTEGKKVA